MKTNNLFTTTILFLLFISLSIAQSPINPNVSTSHNDNTEYWGCVKTNGNVNKLIEIKKSGLVLNSINVTWNGNSVHSIKIKDGKRHYSPGTYLRAGVYYIEVELWDTSGNIIMNNDEDFEVTVSYTIGYSVKKKFGIETFTRNFTECGDVIDGTGTAETSAANNLSIINSGNNAIVNLELTKDYSNIRILVNSITNPTVRKVISIIDNAKTGKYQFELSDYNLPHGLYQLIIQMDESMMTEKFMHSKF